MSDSPSGSGARERDHQAGDTVREGRFVISGRLGEGGQATTFDAVDKREGRRVTVKRFRVRGAKAWKEVELAEREARVLATLHHPNLPVYVDHFEEEGSLYLVTEHITGDTVASLRAAGPAREETVVRFLRDAADALDYLHTRPAPLVHRDIKPSNVIRRPDGSFAIIDFGAVRERLKASGSTVVGTFGYMAPEQFQGRAMPASDVYAVGTTAIAMLTGREPEDLPHKGLAIDVEASLPGARPALVRALSAMVEPDPDRRAAKIGPLIEELGRHEERDGERAGERDEDANERGARGLDRERLEGEGRHGRHRDRERDRERDRREGPYDPAEQAQRVVTEAEEQVKRVAGELGDQVRRVVAEMAGGNREGARREARRAAEVAKREVKRAAKEIQREARKYQQAKAPEFVSRAVAEAHRRQKRKRQEARLRERPLGGPVLLLVLLALTLAQVAVLLALKVVAPVVLYVLSAMFFGSAPGKALRAAAAQVSAAGTRAAASIRRARDVVRGRKPPATEREAAAREGSEGSARELGEGSVHVDPHAPTIVSSVGTTSDRGSSDVRVRARFPEDQARGAARIDDDASARDEANAEEEGEEEGRGRRQRRGSW